MKFVMWTMSGDRGYNSTQMFNTMFANRTSAFWQQLGPAVVDNYYIRLVAQRAAAAPFVQHSGNVVGLASVRSCPPVRHPPSCPARAPCTLQHAIIFCQS